MYNKLEIFIKNNQMEFDALQPSPMVWGQLEPNLVQSKLINTNVLKAKFNWLKYFVLSSAMVGSVYYLYKNFKETAPLANIEIQNPTSTLEKNNPEQAPKPEIESAVLPVQLEEKDLSTKNYLELSKEQDPKVAENILSTNTKTFVEIPKPIFKSNRKVGSFMDTLFTGIQSLEINANCSDIKINTHSKSEVIINVAATLNSSKSKSDVDPNDLFNLIFEKKGSLLSVNINRKEQSKLKLRNQKGNLGVLDLQVPESIQLLIKNSYGDLILNGLKNGKAEVLLSSGDVRMENCSGTINAKLSYGDFKSTSTSGKLDLTLSSGDIFLSEHEGEIMVRSSYGDQLILNVKGDINIITSSGDVSLKNVQGDCKIVSSYGDIKLDSVQGNPTLISSSGDIKGIKVQLLKSLSITSSYGDVDMDLMNELSSLNFDMQSKSGDMKIEMENQVFISDKKLLVSNGAISVKTNTSSGDQVFR